jgi:hypothetical protein
VQFETVKLPGRGFPRVALILMDIRLLWMAYFQEGGVDKTGLHRLPPPEALGINKQRKKGVAGQFHKPVVTDRSGK